MLEKYLKGALFCVIIDNLFVSLLSSGAVKQLGLIGSHIGSYTVCFLSQKTIISHLTMLGRRYSFLALCDSNYLLLETCVIVIHFRGFLTYDVFFWSHSSAFT